MQTSQENETTHMGKTNIQPSWGKGQHKHDGERDSKHLQHI